MDDPLWPVYDQQRAYLCTQDPSLHGLTCATALEAVQPPSFGSENDMIHDLYLVNNLLSSQYRFPHHSTLGFAPPNQEPVKLLSSTSTPESRSPQWGASTRETSPQTRDASPQPAWRTLSYPASMVAGYPTSNTFPQRVTSASQDMLPQDTRPQDMQPHIQAPYSPTASQALPPPPAMSSRPRCFDHGCGGRTFSSIGNYMRHMREQTGKDSVRCHFCGVKFGRKSNRDTHISSRKCKVLKGMVPESGAMASSL